MSSQSPPYSFVLADQSTVERGHDDIVTVDYKHVIMGNAVPAVTGETVPR